MKVAWLVMSLAGLWLVCGFINKGLGRIGLHEYVTMIIAMAVFGCSALVIHFKKISCMLKQINTFRI